MVAAVAAAAAMAAPEASDAPMTAEEARRAAREEGLELITAPTCKTGFRSVYQIDRRKPYQAWTPGAKVNAYSLGCFATAEEAALVHARFVRKANRNEGPTLKAAQQGAATDSVAAAAAAATSAAAAAPTAAAATPTAVAASARQTNRRGRSAPPEWQPAEVTAEPEAKRRSVSASAVAPGSQPSAATDAKRRRRETGNGLVSPLADPHFGLRRA